MQTYQFIFGVFHHGRLLFPIGKEVICTHKQAEFICRLLGKQLAGVLHGNDYFAYDYANKVIGKRQ